MEKNKHLCFKVTREQNPNSFTYVLPASVNNIPTTKIARYIVFPLNVGTFDIKVSQIFSCKSHVRKLRYVKSLCSASKMEMRATLPGLSKPIIDKVEKKITVISEGKPNTKTDWVLVELKSTGYYLRHARRSKKKIRINLPDNAVPDSSKVYLHFIYFFRKLIKNLD